jgi:hypothetical protein
VTDDLTRRMADRQVGLAAADLRRDARRFAEAASRFADETGSPASHMGGAHRLAQDAIDLLRQAGRLDGLRDIAGLVTTDTP